LVFSSCPQIHIKDDFVSGCTHSRELLGKVRAKYDRYITFCTLTSFFDLLVAFLEYQFLRRRSMMVDFQRLFSKVLRCGVCNCLAH